jgi:sulfite reductase (NADPH) flavoprotein alpha-component
VFPFIVVNSAQNVDCTGPSFGGALVSKQVESSPLRKSEKCSRQSEVGDSFTPSLTPFPFPFSRFTMHFQEASSNGSAPVVLLGAFKKQLPFSSIAGPTYVTAQSLVQQVAYTLSDKLFTYSPETFELDAAAQEWSSDKEENAHGYATKVHPMQLRSGAGSIALGYMFSKDFNVKRRHIPQSVLASSSALSSMRPALEQLSLLYSVANPFVAHVAAVDYSGSKDEGLVSDYVTSMNLAEELGIALVSSQSAYESQHMSLLATLLAQTVPTIHTYDGVKVGRETTRVIDTLDKSGLHSAYEAALKQLTANEENQYMSLEGKTVRTLKALNEELGTDYKCFEYHGHESPVAVLVCFGSAENSLAAQAATALACAGSNVGVVNVRVYRPFVEAEFFKVLPKSVKVVGVLGQVQNGLAVQESGIHSQLYEDVLSALTFTTQVIETPTVRELKYARSERWTPKSIAQIFDMLLAKSTKSTHEDEDVRPEVEILGDGVQQYTFWTTDDSFSGSAAGTLGTALAKDSAQNVTVSTTFDSLIQGGVQRTDVRKSPKSLEAAYSIDSADATVVTDLAILSKINVLKSVKDGAKVILVLPVVKDEDVEKKLPATFKKAISHRGISLYLIDSSRSSVSEDPEQVESLIVQCAFLRVALGASENIGLQKLASVGSDIHTLERVAKDLDTTLRQIEVPKEWSEIEIEKPEVLPIDVTSNSFVSFDKTEEEPPSILRNWQKAAKGLIFKEAYNTKPSLRPDLTQKTFTVHVKENRRLTPENYDRNIFHIEFDLGTSGLNYDIGEALGIHAENNHDEVMDFIKWYELNPDDVVEVASREDAEGVYENRTVYQSLMQNIDIYGRPPKKFYESLAEFATDEKEKHNLLTLAGPEGFNEFQRRAEVDTITYADVLQEFPSARPRFHDLIRIVSPMKRREYSIASCQAVTPTSVALMVVVIGWVDPKGRDRFGQATRYLWKLPVGAPVTVSVKPSVMKLPPKSTQPLIMAGLGTGLAPFRAFVQHRAMEKAQGKEIGAVLLYMGSRHQREEYCYGEEWEAYQAAGVITLLGRAFSRDQPQKIYIQDRMRQTMDEITQAYIKEDGAFYLCGPTWPVPDVTAVLEEAIARNGKKMGNKKIDGRKEIMKLKDEGRYVLEVY